MSPPCQPEMCFLVGYGAWSLLRSVFLQSIYFFLQIGADTAIFLPIHYLPAAGTSLLTLMAITVENTFKHNAGDRADGIHRTHRNDTLLQHKTVKRDAIADHDRDQRPESRKAFARFQRRSRDKFAGDSDQKIKDDPNPERPPESEQSPLPDGQLIVYFRFLPKKSAILSNGILSTWSYRSTWLAPLMIMSSFGSAAAA